MRHLKTQIILQQDNYTPMNRTVYLPKDGDIIDSIEEAVLKIANKLGLFDSQVATEISQSAIQGQLEESILEDIKILQIALKKDGKYDGIIDGIAGEKTQQGISDLVLENAPALASNFESQKSSSDSSADRIIGLSPERELNR